MARQKLSKKIISLVKSDLIDRMVKDEAALKNLYESTIIEEHLLNDLLPENKDARYWVENYLYTVDGSVQLTLSAIFSSAAAGVNWQSKYDNLLPFVQIAFKNAQLFPESPSGLENEIVHCRAQLKYIADYIDALDEMQCKKEAEWIREMEVLLQDHPEKVKYEDIYQVLMDNWELIKSSTFVYRLLRDIVTMKKKWSNMPEDRQELLKMLRTVSKEWA